MSEQVIHIRLGGVLGRRTILPFVEAYLARCGDGWIVVDTGMPGSTPAILAAMKHHHVHPEEVHCILLTHGHIDHFGSATVLRRALGEHVRIAMHPADRPFVAGERNPRLRAASGAGVVAMLAGSAFMGMAGALGLLPVWSEEELERVIWLEEVGAGDTPVALTDRCGIPLEAIRTPGHSPGSITLRLPGGELFTGDLLSHALDGRSPAWPMLVDEPEQVLPSLQRIAALQPTVIYPGHGRPMVGNAVVEWVQQRVSGKR